MSLGHPVWQGRRKRPLRRLRRDLRMLLPLGSIVFCFTMSATAIFATEWIPSRTHSPPPVSAARVFASHCEPVSAEAAGLARLGGSSTRPDEAENDAQSAPTPRYRAARPRR
jgi:hypothetical protein